MSSTPVFFNDTATTETLLRCYRCGKPVCTKCVRRTPVGLICKECLSNQQAGFYNAALLDYLVAFAVGTVLAIAGGAIAALIGFFLFELFYAPFAGGLIAEGVRFAIRRHRGRYVWLVACLAVIFGSLIGAALFSLLGALSAGRPDIALLILPTRAIAALFNLGFLIYLVLAVGTVYARLRTG